MKTKKILRTNICNGKKHDLKLFQESKIELPETATILADSGYQGIHKIHPNSQTPIKKPRKETKTKTKNKDKTNKTNPNPEETNETTTQTTKLTQEQKASNKKLSSKRITVEHINREIKIFKIMSERYRNRRKRYGLRLNLISGIYNFELGLN